MVATAEIRADPRTARSAAKSASNAARSARSTARNARSAANSARSAGSSARSAARVARTSPAESPEAAEAEAGEARGNASLAGLPLRIRMSA